jgi:predicted nuclease of predicted toxin-antitoxin system
VLENAGHEVECVSDWNFSPADAEILSTALRVGQIVITLDKDFGELIIVHRLRSRGVIRLVGIHPKLQGERALVALTVFESDKSPNTIVTIDPTRLRVRSEEF